MIIIIDVLALIAVSFGYYLMFKEQKRIERKIFDLYQEIQDESYREEMNDMVKKMELFNKDIDYLTKKADMLINKTL